MQKHAMLTVLPLLGVFLASVACSGTGDFFASATATPVTICTSEVLERFKRSDPEQLSYDLVTKGTDASVKDAHWTISQRGETGCVVTLVAEINAQVVETYRWYIDLEEEKIYADNDLSAQLAPYIENTSLPQE